LEVSTGSTLGMVISSSVITEVELSLSSEYLLTTSGRTPEGRVEIPEGLFERATFL
jgi:hypothetical protein